jgi:hypothetical protein
MNYFFHSDGGHGWLAVPRSEINRLGIAEKVSAYSYARMGMVYLEEDCDMGLFMEAKLKRKEPVTIIDVPCSALYSPIRTFSRYLAGRARAAF